MKVYQIHTFDEHGRLQGVSSLAYADPKEAEGAKRNLEAGYLKSFDKWTYRVVEIDILP